MTGNEVVFKDVVVAYADRPNANGRYIPKDVLKNAIEFWKRMRQIDPTHNYILINHPRDTYEEDIRNIAGWIIDMRFDEDKNALVADFKILPFTQWGALVLKLVENGYPIGLSIRGDGKTTEEYITFKGEKFKVNKVKDIILKGFDFVIYPSFMDTIITKQDKTTKILEKAISGEISNDELKKLIDECSGQCDISSVRIPKDEVYQKILEKSDNVLDPSLIHDISKTHESEESHQGGDETMGEKDINVLELKKEKLELELLKKEKELEKIHEKYQALETEYEKLKNEVAKEKAKKDVISDEIKELIAEKEKLLQDRELYKKQVDELIAKINELQEQLERLYEQEKRNKVVVKFMGRVFDEQNRPKIRIVDESEKISTTRWGEIDKTVLRKLVWLSGDEKVMRECFALLDDGWREDWTKLKYPHHEVVKSDDPDYDFDLVLNVNGLRIAVLFMLGRPGMRLTPEQKRNMARHFLKHYQRLYELGKIDRIPFEQALKKIASARVMFKVDSDELDAQVLENILNELLFRGYINVETDSAIHEKLSGDENASAHIVIENDEVQFIYKKLVKGLVEDEDVNETKKESNVVEIDISDISSIKDVVAIHEKDMGDDNLTALIQKAFEDLYEYTVRDADGELTGFARRYSIMTKNDFAIFLRTIIDDAKNTDFEMLNDKYYSMLVVYTLRKLENENFEGLTDLIVRIPVVLNTFFKNLTVLLKNINRVIELYAGNEQQSNEMMKNTQANEETPAQEAQQPNTNEEYGQEEQPMTEGGQNEQNRPLFEKAFDESKSHEEVDEMTKLKEIIELLNKHIELENGENITEENVVEVLEKVLNAYAQAYSAYTEQELKTKILEKALQAVKQGVPIDVIESELADAEIEDEEQLEKIYEKVINMKNEKIHEKTTKEHSEDDEIFPKRKLADTITSKSDDDDESLINV